MMTDEQTPMPNTPAVPVDQKPVAQEPVDLAPVDPKPVARKPAAPKAAPAPPEPASRPRGMSYGGISAAQHALERQERAGLVRKNARRT